MAKATSGAVGLRLLLLLLPLLGQGEFWGAGLGTRGGAGGAHGRGGARTPHCAWFCGTRNPAVPRPRTPRSSQEAALPLRLSPKAVVPGTLGRVPAGTVGWPRALDPRGQNGMWAVVYRSVRYEVWSSRVPAAPPALSGDPAWSAGPARTEPESDWTSRVSGRQKDPHPRASPRGCAPRAPSCPHPAPSRKGAGGAAQSRGRRSPWTGVGFLDLGSRSHDARALRRQAGHGAEASRTPHLWPG